MSMLLYRTTLHRPWSAALPLRTATSNIHGIACLRVQTWSSPILKCKNTFFTAAASRRCIPPIARSFSKRPSWYSPVLISSRFSSRFFSLSALRFNPTIFATTTTALAFKSLHFGSFVYCEAVSYSKTTIPTIAFTEKNVVSAQTLSNTALLREIWKLVKPDFLLLLAVILTAVAAAWVNIKTPIITGQLVNVIARSMSSTGKSLTMEELQGPAIKLLSLFLVQGLFTFLHISLVSLLGENVAKRVKLALFTSLLRQDISFFDAHQSGELISRLTTDVSDFKHTFKQVITSGLKSITQTVGSALQLISISASLTLTLISTMPVLYAFLNLYGIYLRKLSKIGREIDAKASGLAGEAIANIRTVRSFAAEAREGTAFEKVSSNVARTSSYLGLHIGLFQGITNASIGGMVLTVLYYGGRLVVKGELTGGDLMSYMLATQNAQKALVSLGVLFGQTIKAMGSAARVFDFIDLKSIIPLEGGIMLDTLGGTIEFSHIHFTYPTRPDQEVLTDFSLVVPRGKMVALCGTSGSGKSTVTALLERFYDPTAGTIRIDGIPLEVIDPSWLRKQIGFINQEPVLFATSVMENIRYGRPNATNEEVVAAAIKANAHDFITGFPKGYDTTVGERGVTISGGQKQRIAIARAILKDPSILILDEATSALDTQSEKMVQDALEKLMEGRTVLVIAHRLSTIQNADLIVVMSKGQIQEVGSHKELMRKKGRYYSLYNQLAENA